MLKIRLNRNSVNMVALLLIVALIMAGMVYGSMFSLLAFAINCVLFAVLPIEMVITDLFFLLPFATVYKSGPGSISFVTLLLVFVILVWMVKRKCVFPKGNYLLLGLVFIWFVFMVDLLQGRLSINNIFRNVSGVFLLYFILFFIDREDMEKTIRYTGYGLYLSSFIALFAAQIPNFYVFVRKVGYNAYITNRFSGMNGDPNYYSIMLVLVLLGALVMQKERNLYFWCALGLTLFFGIQTYSKSFMIIFVIVLTIILFELIRKPQNRRYALLFLLLLLIGIQFTLSGRLESVNLLLRRFQAADNISELTTGRWDIWQAYLSHLAAHPFILLFGSGISAPLLEGHGGAHNFLIELLYYLGIVGTVLFGSVVWVGYRIATQRRSGLTLGKCSLVVLFILYMGLQMLFSNELYYHIGYVLMLCVCSVGQIRFLNGEAKE